MLAHQIIKRIVWYIVLIVSHRCSRGILRAGQAVTVISDCFPSQCPLSKFFANLQISIQRWTNINKTKHIFDLCPNTDTFVWFFFYQLNMKNIWLNDRKRILLSRRVKKTLTKRIKHWVWKTLINLTLISVFSSSSSSPPPPYAVLQHSRPLSAGSDTSGHGHLTPPLQTILVKHTYTLLQLRQLSSLTLDND